jgi:hypothetical protein
VPNELSSIEGLADKHLRVLARHYVTDLRGLVQADRRVIYRALVNLRPRPTLELISRWQDEARSMLDEVVTATSEWHTVASFAVIFSQRQREDGWERRAAVERTEVEPERNPQVWPGWDCAPICAWMTGQLSPSYVPAASPPSDPPPPAEAAEPPPPAATEAPAPEPMPPPGPVTARPQLHIDSAALIDATGRTDVVTGGEPAADPRTELVAPVRVLLTVSGAKPGTPLRAVTRVQRPDGPGWNPRDPVILPDSGQAEFDLSEVPAGDHKLSLIAWAPDASAKPVSVRLPRITIQHSRGE